MASAPAMMRSGGGSWSMIVISAVSA